MPPANKPLLYNQLYYIIIAPGDFNGPTPVLPLVNKGIMDQAGNKFPGIFSPGGLYFRTSSNVPPALLNTPAVPIPTQITNITLTGATIQATFDRPGTAYFMLVNQGSPAPSRAEILGPGVNIGPVLTPTITGVAYIGTALKRGSFAISQINPIAQYGTINFSLVNNSHYDVWMFAANNDLPYPIPTTGPYGSSFAAVADNSGTPTFSDFVASDPAGSSTIISAPQINICVGSYQPLNVPI